MSPLRTAMLTIASVLSALSTLALIDVVNGGTQTAPNAVVISVTCAALAAWIIFAAFTICDRICGKLKHLEEYGDRRESDGYLAAVRDIDGGTGSHLSRVK